ncbi:hypothetical protein SAMN07250955_12016 [Arboricoccus pini]|uniref:BMFP domain-containing protein YqiC n=1 Tax=Arboricoccus pini TaxID=1963835 RepID=A0A212S1Y0_9PROT|nr:accessory factor UbiK family protein [Arboricoccus pini]SNB79079.1 hypothetical protein SAMN07250955_12016 [Arboricoccus pini]
MQTENRLLDDLARMASGAINTLGGVRAEIEARVKERVERLANEMDLVTREEFDAVQAMAAQARLEQERLEAKVIALETRLAAFESGATTSSAVLASAGAGRPSGDIPPSGAGAAV